MKKKVDYNDFSKTFSNSRKSLKWPEIDYILSKYDFNWKNILDIWCWSWRLLSNLLEKNILIPKYFWVDSSSWMIAEALKNNDFKNYDFFVSNMTEKFDFIWDFKFDFIFFIASYHHLDNLEDRILALNNVKTYLNDGWIIFLTNWALNSEILFEKYKDCIILNSKNQYESIDYDIKIWEFSRFYHCFSPKELKEIFTKTWFDVIENRLFDGGKNYISIIKK